MDLQLALRVLWRFRILVAVGFVLACVLALLSMVRIHPTGSPIFSYRTQPQYESDTTVFVTTHGFPWGSIKLNAGTRPGSPHGTVDYTLLRGLATLYIQFANSTDVMKELAKSGPINGVIQANQLLAPDSSTIPLIQLAAIAPTREGAFSLATRHLHAFQTWLSELQHRTGTQPDNRVIIQQVSGPLPAHLLLARKKTKPILIFLATMVAFCGLAFLLENLHPRIRAVADQPEEEEAEAAETRTLAAYTPAATRQPIGRKRSRRARRRA